MTSPGPQFWRALAAFLLLPGIVAFLAPWLLRPRGAPAHPVGLGLLVTGAVLLLWCVRDFYVAGRGSLAPWAPPERLVMVGLYRFSRNPMYLAVGLILAGWALTFRTTPLWVYAGIVGAAFHLRVVFGEEPWLARRYGEQWTAYCSRVPRWITPVPMLWQSRKRRGAG